MTKYPRPSSSASGHGLESGAGHKENGSVSQPRYIKLELISKLLIWAFLLHPLQNHLEVFHISSFTASLCGMRSYFFILPWFNTESRKCFNRPFSSSHGCSCLQPILVEIIIWDAGRNKKNHQKLKTFYLQTKFNLPRAFNIAHMPLHKRNKTGSQPHFGKVYSFKG